MPEYLLLFISTVFVNNIVLVKFLGLCPFMGVSRKVETAIGMSAATTFVLTLSAVLSYIINSWILAPLDLEFLRTIAFIIAIAAVVNFTEMVVHKTSPLLYNVLGIFLPLITTNCAVLGVALINVQDQNNLMQSLVYGFGAALGFSLVLILFAALRERLNVADVPRPFQGSAIGLITAGLMSLAFMGLTGLVKAEVIILMLVAILTISCLAGVFGLILGYAAIRFKVEGNPVVDQIDALLPQTQCGQCTYPGCRPYAEAIASGEAPINQCPPGGQATIVALADLLEVEVLELNAEHGKHNDIPLVAMIDEQVCIGCTLCIQACPVDAILGAANLMHTVIADECTGCELCVPPCPVDCIDMLTVKQTIDDWQWTPPVLESR